MDGLNYLNYKYQYQDKYHLNLYYGNLQDLYNQLHVGVDVNHKYNDIMFNSKFRFYSNNEEGDQKLGHVDSQYYGFLQNASIQYHTLGLGYQENKVMMLFQ